jgi:hypothetical protein
MIAPSIYGLSLLVFLGFVRDMSDDARSVVARAGKVCRNFVPQAAVTLERKRGTWRIDDLRYRVANVPTDSDLSPAASLPALRSFSLAATWGGPDECQVTAEGIRRLAPLRLRRFVFPFNVGEDGLKAICTFSQLEDLDLGMNGPRKEMGDKGFTEIQTLRNLRRLNLAGVGVSDSSIEMIAAIKGLEELDLSGWNVHVSDTGLAKLTTLHELRFLTLDKVGAAGIAALGDLLRLEHLEIGTYDPAATDADLSGLTRLKWLGLGLTEETLKRVRPPKSLTRLAAPYETIRKVDLRSSPRIENIDIDLATPSPRPAEPFDVAVVDPLRELHELTLRGAVEADVRAIASLGSLHVLRLRGDCTLPLGDGGMRALTRLQNLESLAIDDYYGGMRNLEIDAGTDVVLKLPNLRRLELRGFPALTTQGLANVWRARQLRSLGLHLTGERLDASLDNVFSGIAGLSELEVLSLSFVTPMTVTDGGLKRLASLKKLRHLDLGDIEGYSDDALARLMDAIPSLEVVERTYKARG